MTSSDVYFLTSETFSIDAMLTRVTMLPRDDRWDAMARGALRDDLYAVLESLTRSVLEVSNPRHDAQARLAEWSELNADALGRARAALGGIERMSHAGIAALSVALRTLRTVTKPASSGAAAPVPAQAAPVTAPKAADEPGHRGEGCADDGHLQEGHLQEGRGQEGSRDEGSQGRLEDRACREGRGPEGTGHEEGRRQAGRVRDEEGRRLTTLE